MTNARLDFLADIYINRRINETFSISFQTFLNYVDCGKWEVQQNGLISITH